MDLFNIKGTCRLSVYGNLTKLTTDVLRMYHIFIRQKIRYLREKSDVLRGEVFLVNFGSDKSDHSILN